MSVYDDRINANKLYEDMREAWESLHHNASMRGRFPEMRNEFEEHLFWDFLRGDVSWLVEDLHDLVKEKFDEDLTFYQYGRGGATIAPSEWMAASASNSFGGLNYTLEAYESYLWDSYGDDDEDEEELINRVNAEAEKEAAHVIEVIDYINNYWDQSTRYLAEWWQETKDANELDEIIAAHDDMILVSKQVWVKKGE